MNTLLRVPLLPAALAAAAAAAAQDGAALGPAPAAVAIVPALLSEASADRTRRAMWGAVALMLCAVPIRMALAPATVALPLALPVADPFAGARAGLAEALLRLVPDPEGALLVGIVLGERAALNGELRDAFARSGTAHLLAISGFNMTLVAAAVALALRGRAGPLLCAPGTAFAVAGYAFLVGPAPSVARAALMAAVGSLGLALGRPSLGANALCAAICAMVVLDPAVVASLSFRLSVAGTAGLIVLQAPIAGRLTPLPSVLREGMAATLAASAFTAPIIAAAFGRISLVAPVANVLAVPLFAPVLAAGAATAALGSLSLDPARPLAVLAFGLARAMRAVVEAAAAPPAAAIDLPPGPLAAVLGAVTAALPLGAWWLFGRALGSRRRGLELVSRRLAARLGALVQAAVKRLSARALGVTAAGVLVVALSAAAGLPLLAHAARGPDLQVRALDVGQGDAFLVRAGGHLALIDGGPDPARLLALLGASLAPWERRIDVVAMTHAHLDHGAGLIPVFERYEVGLAVEPRGLEDVALRERWRAAIARRGVELRALGAGDRLRLGAATIEILAPLDGRRADVQCLVLRLVRGPFSMLFTADATDQTLGDLLLAPEALAASVYVPPHHGASTTHAASLARAVRPRVAILSVGAANRYGHPTSATLAALGAIDTYRTDRDGTLEVTADGTRVVVRTHATGVPPPRRGSLPYPAAPR